MISKQEFKNISFSTHQYIKSLELKELDLEYKLNRSLDNISSCGSSHSHYFCPHCGNIHISVSYCNNRACSNPACIQKRRRKAYMKIKKKIPIATWHFLKLITLTWKPVSYNDIRKTKQEFNKKFKSLLKHFSRTATPITDYISVFEIKQNTAGLFYIHLHIIANVKYIPQIQLSNLWNHLTGNPIIDIRAINSKGAIDYVSKYISKGIDFNSTIKGNSYIPTQYITISQIHKSRLFITSLDIKAISETKFKLLCPKCGNEMISEYVLGSDVWHYFNLKGG